MEVALVEALCRIDPAAWNALAGSHDPFVRYEFLAGLERHGCLAGHGWYPAHLTVRDGGRLIGALPLYARDNSYGEFVFDWAWAEACERAGGRYYPKLVSAVPYTPVVGPRLLLAADRPDRAAIARALVEAAMAQVRALPLSSWHCLFPADAQLPLFESPDLLVREGCQYHWFNRDYENFENFLATLTSKRRKEIRRERRDVAASGVTIEVLCGPAIERRHWKIFHAFYCATFDRKWGAPRLTLPFFESLSTGMADAAVLILARHGGEYVAGAFALRGGDTLYGRHWGCSKYVRHLHFELCYYQTVEFCIREGLRHLDAGAQGEHKIPRGFEPLRTWSLHFIREPGLRRAVAEFLSRETALMERYVDDVAAHTPYRSDP